MESVYAALILHSASKKINETNIEKILDAAGVKADKNQVKALVAGLEGKNLDEIISSVATAPVAVSAAPAAASGKEVKPKEEKKKDKKEEKKEEEEPTGIGALFG
ncbi:MAG: 50S ribosomal protein P1 [Candidatus Lokiarchaeota archaeon]|nr:50S ribosomal protein P1 [Candidatus Lokiarchaeota archaeon]